MDLQAKLNAFRQLDYKEQLPNWHTLVDIASSFLHNGTNNAVLAEEISIVTHGHRMLMASSKAYENAVDLDITLCRLALEIARVAYSNGKELLPFLEDALYYSNYYPDLFNKQILEQEKSQISASV